MFTLLGRTCSRCGGCLVDEWKLDLEKEREVVCLNCGVRVWERLKKRGRPKKNPINTIRNNIISPGYADKTTGNDSKKWQRSRVKREIGEIFEDETHKQILKRQSSNRKKRRNPVKKRLPGMSSRWLEV